jgi:5-deoxy-glucuronate isomerase
VSDLLLRDGEWDVVDPGSADWRYLSFRVDRLHDGENFTRNTGGEEIALVPLGGRCAVDTGGERYELGGRASVFDGMPWALYLPRDTEYAMTALGDVEVAVSGALADERLEPRLVTPDHVEIEVRGSGNATRQINHILKPEFPAQRLLVVEVFTPAGNWSSYPPHKHDTDDPPREVDLDEVYYFRFRDRAGYGFQRVYTQRRDETVRVTHGDVVAVRDGYHPFVTAHGYDAYYLNVLAGSRRSMAATDDPAHARFRRHWPPPDPRLPMVPPPAGRESAQ